MQKLHFLDSNCSIGRVNYPYLHDIPDVEGLLKEMKTAGIEEALVYHISARDSFPPLGNSMLMEEIKNRKEFHPVWVVMPHHTGEMPHPEMLLSQMKDNTVKAVRMYPKPNHHSFSISEWCSGELLRELEKNKIILILDMDISSWEDVYSVMINHPQLAVIASNCSYRNNRYIYPLFDKFSGLYVELSRFMGAGAIEDVVQKYGSNRLIFGTNMPQFSGTAAISLLTYSDISTEDKNAIANGNLSKLLKQVWS